MSKYLYVYTRHVDFETLFFLHAFLSLSFAPSLQGGEDA